MAKIRLQMRLVAFLCMITLLMLQVLPATSLAYTLSATGSALGNGTMTGTGSALGNGTVTGTGSALENVHVLTASGSALDIEITEENELPRIKNVVLPTITNDTYDFTIDVDGLLGQMHSDYTEGDSVYFLTVRSQAQLKISARQSNTNYELVVQSKTSNAGRERLEQNLIGKTMEELPIVFSSYYIWQPDVASTTGDGKWTRLSIDNYMYIMELKLDEGGYITEVSYLEMPYTDTVEKIWDGNIYTITYEEISSIDAAAQFYDVADASELLSYTNASLYVKAEDEFGVIWYHPATLQQNEPGSVYYRHATYTYADTSKPATIINKSTFDVCVTAQIQVSDSDGLVFCDSPDFYAEPSDTANIYMALTADQHEIPISNNIASASYILKGSGENSIRYLIMDGLVEDRAVGTLYHYLSPIDSYASVEFQIEAAIDTRKSANPAWKSYVKALSEGIYNRPTINVIYTMEEVTRDVDNSTYYISENGNTYIITDGTYGNEDFWISAMLLSPDVQEVILEQKVVYIVPKKVRNKKRVI